ncbi:MAG: histidinol-phosphate transaminase [Deltaproteobacteria bacterium]|uniref:Histidinol-phosphate aminotransferase n=1 Tax=Candidatus Zymogenus saltonus TaxID=2844893 RepID=A0A9D8KDL3_9DELT|nr:histidinol-phosphate transaminase [Candidatus Zymogenus saltonus]
MIKKIVPEHIQSLTPYPPGKPIEELERELGITGSIKLASNENPLGPSPMAVEAMKKAVANVHRYPDGSCFYLKEKLSELQGLKPENYIIGNGSNEIIEILIRVLVREGDEVIMGDPSFIVYRLVTQGVGGKSVIVPLKDWVFDLDAMKGAITDRTRLIFIDNPNNPVGTTIKKDDFSRFMEGLPRSLVVVLDEAYKEFDTSGESPIFSEYMEGDVPIISTRTFSKLYGISGARIGYGVAVPETISMLNRIRSPFNVNSFAQAGALAALSDHDFVKKTLDLTRSGMEYLYGEFKKLGLNYIPSQANFVLVDVGQPSPAVYNAMLKEGVIVRPMAGYGLANYIRITLGIPEENERFVAALKKILERGL